jgi:choline dehydrogenase-like flavoprotein
MGNDGGQMIEARFDCVIVGAGSAGCALVNRLSERTGCRVLVLESGPKDSNPWIHIPIGYNERFNGMLRREMRNAEWFMTTRQAQGVIDAWLRQYDHVRPHHDLCMCAPVPETILEQPQISGPDRGG